MNILSDVITYIRRIIKSPSNADITDALLIDYINRFWIMDVDARIQLFDLKTKYQFQTQPGVDRYNMPLYDIQIEPGPQNISFYPVYQGVLGPAYINGIPVTLQTQKEFFYNFFPNVVQNMPVVAIGNGTNGPYSFTFTIAPNNGLPLNPPIQSIIRGHVDIEGIIATGNNVDPIFGTDLSKTAGTVNIPSTSIYPGVYITSTASDGSNIIVQDSGQFLLDNLGARHNNFGLLMAPGTAPYGYSSLPNTLGQASPYSTTQNTINYFTGEVNNVTFPFAIPAGANIGAQCFFFQSGLPRAILFNDNILTFRTVPDRQYLVEIDAYLSPAAFLNSERSLPFAYMAEYLARGAARKILSDTGDVEQFQFYEPFFQEQEMLVWKRSQRQFTANRTQTIYSHGHFFGFPGTTNTGSVN